jgi:hypothetical protein
MATHPRRHFFLMMTKASDVMTTPPAASSSPHPDVLDPGIALGLSPALQSNNSKQTSLPIEVIIVTPDYEVRGLVHVSRKAREDRRITDLLNDNRRRFLAVTEAELQHRHQPSAPRHYPFLQVHIDNIQMIHPAAQSLLRHAPAMAHADERLAQFREKLRASKL